MNLASNLLGDVNQVEEVARRVHAVGGRLCVDAVAYAPHRLLDVRAHEADVVVFSYYKVFGPHLGMMWTGRHLLHRLASINHYFIGLEESPYHLQPGGINYELAYGCMGIEEYLIHVGTSIRTDGTPRERMQAAFDAFMDQEGSVAERLRAWLRSRRNVPIFGNPQIVRGRRMPIISFTVDGVHSETVVRHIDAVDIGIRFGDFYARRLIEALGLADQGGVVRVSLAHYNTSEEMDRLIEQLEDLT